MPAQRPAPTRGPDWGAAGTWSVGFVAVLWVAEILDALLRLGLDREGIRPLETEGLSGILAAPLLHGGFGHLIGNTVPLLVLGFVLLLGGVRRWAAVTAVVWLVGGLGTWLFGGAGTLHIGASGVVFGWLTYLIVRGFFSRRPAQITVGALVFLFYGGMLLGVLPNQPGVSWQGHLFGAVGGVLAAWWFASDDRRPARRSSYGS